MTENEFHESRIAFAILDKTIVWTMSKLDHKTWLNTQYNVSKSKFEKLVRGYIRKEGNNVNIIFYKGSDFRETHIKNKYIKFLICLADIKFDYTDLIIGNGVKIGEPGEIWRPLTIYDIINRDKVIEYANCISIPDLIEYSKFIMKQINKYCHLHNDNAVNCKNTLLEELYTVLGDMSKGYKNSLFRVYIKLNYKPRHNKEEKFSWDK